MVYGPRFDRLPFVPDGQLGDDGAGERRCDVRLQGDQNQEVSRVKCCG